MSIQASSPFHGDQFQARNQRFWMTSHPIVNDDRGIRPLLSWWGGEVVTMWMKDEAVLEALARIGKARIVELAVPVRRADCGLAAAKAVIATYVRSRGGIPAKCDFDLSVAAALPASSVRTVHTEGEVGFDGMARTYPAGYVDVSVGRWKALTGEDD